MVAASLVTPQGSALAAPSTGGQLVTVNGNRLWVDDSGPRDAPVVIYMHGGPGIGALEFEAYMKPALAGRVRLISVDQRGALRSDPIKAGAPMNAADIVADFEALRVILAIDRWQVVGHSFGGTFALRYALMHPDRVTRLTFECPAYDASSAVRWLTASAAQLLNGIAVDAALEAVRLADPATPIDAAYIASMERTMAALGSRRQDLYVAQARHRDMFSRLAAIAGLTDARWEQGAVPGRALLHSDDFFAPMLSRVKEIRTPMLLVRGSSDHACSPAEIAAVVGAGGKLVTVPDAGHFVHVEQPQALADLIAS